MAESSVVLPPEIGAYAMPSYRIYKLSADNHIVGVSEVVECESDQEAITQATKKLDGLDIEIWQGQRSVIRLKSMENSRPAASAVTSE